MLTITKAVNYSLVAAEKLYGVINAEMSAADKTLTLGYAAGTAVIVYNYGTASIDVENIAADTAHALATTKAVLVLCGTAGAATYIALN